MNQQKNQFHHQIFPIYCIFLGFKNSGKTTFIESILYYQLQRTSHIQILQYGEKYAQQLKQNILFTEIPSSFLKTTEDNNYYIKIIDTPGIHNISELQELLQILSTIIQNHPFIFVWVFDYTSMNKYHFLSSKENIDSQILNFTSFGLLNKMDLKTCQDKQIDKIYSLLTSTYLYQLSAKNILTYNIVNNGSEQQQTIFFDNFLKINSSLLNIKKSTCTQYCKNKFLNNKSLIDRDYILFLKDLQNQILLEYQKHIQKSLQPTTKIIQISSGKQLRLLQLLKLLQQEANKQIRSININNIYQIELLNNQNEESLTNYFIEQNQNIIYFVEQLKIINLQWQNKITSDFQVYINGDHEDDELITIIDIPNQSFIQSLQYYFHKLNVELEKIQNDVIQEYQEILKSLTESCQEFSLKNSFYFAKKIIQPLLFLQFNLRLSIGQVVFELSSALNSESEQIKQQIVLDFNRFKQNYNQLIEKAKYRYQEQYNYAISFIENELKQ